MADSYQELATTDKRTQVTDAKESGPTIVRASTSGHLT